MENKTTQNSSAIIVIAIAVIIIITVVGVWFLKSGSSEVGALHRITYEVEADGGYAYIVYTDSSGQNTEGKIYSTPFSMTFTFPKGQEVYLTASNPSQSGTITCAIRLDHRDWKESKGTHPIDSIACGGIVK